MHKKCSVTRSPGHQSTGSQSHKVTCYILSFVFLAAISFLLSPGLLWADETIETKEYERYYYKDGSMLKLEGQFEHTYHLDLEKNILTRTRIYDVVNKKVTPDHTEYHMERQLLSHPTNADRYILTPVIRAVGQTSADTLEMLIIDDAYVQTTSSTSNEIILSRSKRIQ